MRFPYTDESILTDLTVSGGHDKNCAAQKFVLGIWTWGNLLSSRQKMGSSGNYEEDTHSVKKALVDQLISKSSSGGRARLTVSGENISGMSG